MNVYVIVIILEITTIALILYYQSTKVGYNKKRIKELQRDLLAERQLRIKDCSFLRKQISELKNDISASNTIMKEYVKEFKKIK